MDTTALGYNPGADTGSLWRRFAGHGGGYMLPGAVFLLIPAVQSANTEGLSRVAIWVLVLVVGVLYLGSALVTGASLAFRLAWLVGLAGAILALGVAAGFSGTIAYDCAYVAVPLALLLPWSWSKWIVPAVGAALLGLAWALGDALAATLAIMGCGIAWMMGSGISQEVLTARLVAAEERNAMLAVAAERARIGRDLHDILGHSLTAITVKAQLARQLLAADPDAAASQLAELEQVSRQALADVRSTVSDMRQVRLAGELASGRTVLESAGIACEAPSSVPSLSDERSELFGWALREAVTNVVRHSGATTCRIWLTEESLSVADDGRGLEGPEGNGLAGLRERLAQQGFRLDVTSSRTGTTLSVLPEGER